mgnify:CR=1 FL=1
MQLLEESKTLIDNCRFILFGVAPHRATLFDFYANGIPIQTLRIKPQPFNDESRDRCRLAFSPCTSQSEGQNSRYRNRLRSCCHAYGTIQSRSRHNRNRYRPTKHTTSRGKFLTKSIPRPYAGSPYDLSGLRLRTGQL